MVFPDHDEIGRHTLRGALRDADIDEDEFIEHVNAKVINFTALPAFAWA
jgi:hypothetical protein